MTLLSLMASVATGPPLMNNQTAKEILNVVSDHYDNVTLNYGYIAMRLEYLLN